MLSFFTLPQGVSWVTVRYMLAEVQYGGRVTDDYDKRLLQCFARVRVQSVPKLTLLLYFNDKKNFLTTLKFFPIFFFLQVWFSKRMFDASFCFYNGYRIPLCKTVEEYMSNIESLPTVDTPQVLGLHPNADIT